MGSIYQKKQKASFQPSTMKTKSNSSFQYQGFPVQTKVNNQQQKKNQDLSGYRKPQSGDMMDKVMRSRSASVTRSRSASVTRSQKSGMPIQVTPQSKQGIINRAVSGKLANKSQVLIKYKGMWTKGIIIGRAASNGNVRYSVKLVYYGDRIIKIYSTSKDIQEASIGNQFDFIKKDKDVDLPKGLNCGEYAAKGAVKLGERNVDVDYKDSTKWKDSGEMGWDVGKKAPSYFTYLYGCDTWSLATWQKKLQEKGPLIVGGTLGQGFMKIVSLLREKVSDNMKDFGHAILVVGAVKKKNQDKLLYLDSLNRGTHEMDLKLFQKHSDGSCYYVKKKNKRRFAIKQ